MNASYVLGDTSSQVITYQRSFEKSLGAAQAFGTEIRRRSNDQKRRTHIGAMHHATRTYKHRNKNNQSALLTGLVQNAKVASSKSFQLDIEDSK
jgi:hypothetical protein